MRGSKFVWPMLGVAVLGLSSAKIARAAGTSYSIVSYQGKCLDYGPAVAGSTATVYLNDCSTAHSVVVQEVNDRYQVILRAGAQVIGVHNPAVNTMSGATTTPTEYSLELQTYNPVLA